MIKQLYIKIKQLYEKYERLLIPGTLVFGVIVDTLTFANIKTVYAFLVLGFHILLAGATIAFVNAYNNEEGNRILRFLRLISPLIIQYSFGAMLSACFIFYFFSGSLYVSWPFILIIVVLMISNDVFRKYYLREHVQVSVYFFLLFSISAIILPFVLQKLGTQIFLLSGALSLFFIFLYITFLSRFIDKQKFSVKQFAIPISAIFIFINVLYFLNIIPPIPLSLRDVTVGHTINPSNGGYIISIEKESFFDKVLPGQVIHKRSDGMVAVYTAIFAPGSLKTEIYHHWQHKENGKWVTKSRIPYGIIGGRKEGFRGYSIKSVVPEGKWRVSVETARGQVLGRANFYVEETDNPPPLEDIIK